MLTIRVLKYKGVAGMESEICGHPGRKSGQKNDI